MLISYLDRLMIVVMRPWIKGTDWIHTHNCVVRNLCELPVASVRLRRAHKAFSKLLSMIYRLIKFFNAFFFLKILIFAYFRAIVKLLFV